MARKSRKQAAGQKVPAPNPGRVYGAALYLRLSKEDSGREGSDSIEMQEYLLQQYASGQPDLAVKAIYRDNGLTGTNFLRPGFEQMMEAVERGEIDCIIVKDLSRFGRNYVEAGFYLEKIFPLLGVRFVAVNDGYDTLKSESYNEMVVSLKNIVNSLFAKDISKKTGSALHRKQEKGEFIGSFAPYGYVKSPENKHKLMIDPKTWPVVKEIFSQRLKGIGYGQIAKSLNERDIPCPTMERFLKGGFRNTDSGTMCIRWTASTIKHITKNMVYAGHMAQGKQMRSLCSGIPNGELGREDWVIVQNTHAPIVSQDTFNAVQAINTARSGKSSQGRQLQKTENIMAGLLYCKDCGKTMARCKSCSEKGHIRYTYGCRTRKASKGMSGCTLKNIGEGELFDIIQTSVNILIAATVECESILDQLKVGPKAQAESLKLETSLGEVQKAILKNTEERSRLFERYCDKIIGDEEYLYLKQQYDAQASELRSLQEQLWASRPDSGEASGPESSCAPTFSNDSEVNALTRNMVLELICHITVSGRNDILITWNFKDRYQSLQKDRAGRRA